jgi:6-pyruvoyltetrahydropterin/6-carboxytetrahydropterin synthase
MTVYLTRRENFNAAHKLWVDDWSEEKNFEIFGKCANKNFHGHNYDLQVTIKGTPHPVTGFIMDAKKLSKLLKSKICNVLDHTNLNLDDNFLPKGVLGTTENLVYYIWQELTTEIQAEGCQLHCVKLYETRNIWAEYYGE